MMGRLERLATLTLLFLTACTVFPTPRTPAHAETRRVAIPGEEADTLAETIAPDEDGLVPVRTHDGRELWVRASALGGASLVPGTWALVRQNEALVVASVTRALDDFVEVDVSGTRAIVPVGEVVARLHHGPESAATDLPPPDVTPPPPPPPAPPPTPIDQMVVLESAPLARAGMLAGCEGATAHVVFADGSDVRVPRGDVHPLRVHAGDHVSALWNGSPYPAIVLATREGLVRARWEDESEQWIELTDVVSVEGAATGALSGCPSRAVLVDEGARARIGRVLACDDTHATVLAADGVPRSVDRATLVRVPVRIGDAVEARWNGTPYEAFVLSIGERVHVRWYDGSEGDVDPADLVTFRAREARPSQAPTCPAT